MTVELLNWKNNFLQQKKTGIAEKAENTGYHPTEFHCTAQCSRNANSCSRKRANSLKEEAIG